MNSSESRETPGRQGDAPHRAVAAVLWDMDGTLVDTEPYWMAAETELIHEHGGSWTHEDALQLVGSGLWESARIIQEAGVALPADEIVHRLTETVRVQLRELGVPWRAGARELLAELREAGIPTALVTMSVRPMAEDIVAAIPFPAFELLVTGDEVDRPKPHPEPYLRAAALLGVDIADCVAIEDSVAGVTSAAASGAFTIGVPNVVALDGTPASILLPTLVGLDVAELSRLAAGSRPEPVRGRA